MSKNQEVERIAKKLDKMVHKKNTVSGAKSCGICSKTTSGAFYL